MSRPFRSTNERGYGIRHRDLRRRFSRLVASGEARCARCRRLIGPDEPWDLDHADDRNGYLGPAHRRCNRSVAAAKTNRERAAALRASKSKSPTPAGAPKPESWWWATSWSRHWGDESVRYPWCSCDFCREITPEEIEALRLEVLARRA